MNKVLSFIIAIVLFLTAVSSASAEDRVSCPVPGGKVHTHSYQGNSSTGHCGANYGFGCYASCPTTSRRAKAIDVKTDGKDVILPEVNGQVVNWKLTTKGYPVYGEEGGGIGHTFEAKVGTDTWYLDVLHLQQTAIGEGESRPSGTVIAKSVIAHAHMTVGKNLKQTPRAATETDCDPGWLPSEFMCDGSPAPASVQNASSGTTQRGLSSSSLNQSQAMFCTKVGTPNDPNPCVSSGSVSECKTQYEGKTVVLDPGHGTSLTDPIAVGAPGETERNNNLAQKIKQKLESVGFKVLLTHTGAGINSSDRYDDYQKRIDVANNNNADLFVAIHFNSDNSGPFSLYADRSIISTDGVTTQPNPNIVTENVQSWNENSRKANTAITKRLTEMLNAKYKTNFSPTIEKADHACEGRVCGGHLYVIGPEGQPANPDDPRSIIKKELKAPGAYIETIGMEQAASQDLDLFAEAYAAGIKDYFGPGKQCPASGTGVPLPSGFPFYCQADPKWANRCSMAAAGCGPTSMAMALSYFGVAMTPPEVDEVFNSRNWRLCGNEPSYMEMAVEAYLPQNGFEIVKINNSKGSGQLDLNKAQEYLSNGYLIIGSVYAHIFIVDQVNPAENAIHLRDPARCGQPEGYWHDNQRPWGNGSWWYAYAVKKVR